MSIEELEKKPHNEWTTEEIVYWLTECAKEDIMAEIDWDYGSKE